MLVLSAFLSFLFLLISQPVQSAFIPAGTPVEAKLESSVKTASAAAGDSVVAVVTGPLRAAGNIIVPAGSRLNGRVETVEPATREAAGRVRIVFREIEFSDGRRVSTWITNSFGGFPPKRKLRYVLYMGAGGAAGALIGGKAARAAGILGGALIGFVIAGNSGNSRLSDLSLSPGKILHLQLGEDLTLQ